MFDLKEVMSFEDLCGLTVLLNVVCGHGELTIPMNRVLVKFVGYTVHNPLKL